MGPKPKPPSERFWAKVDKSGGPNSCWTWTGDRRGKYGRFRVTKTPDRTESAHRFSYELKYGQIEHGLYVCHRCDNTICVNPEHLFLGTAGDNLHDAMAKGRRPCPLTAEDIRQMRALGGTDKPHYGRGAMTQKQLAKKFNVSQSEVAFVIRKKRWNHIV